MSSEKRVIVITGASSGCGYMVNIKAIKMDVNSQDSVNSLV